MKNRTNLSQLRQRNEFVTTCRSYKLLPQISTMLAWRIGFTIWKNPETKPSVWFWGIKNQKLGSFSLYRLQIIHHFDVENEKKILKINIQNIVT